MRAVWVSYIDHCVAACVVCCCFAGPSDASFAASVTAGWAAMRPRDRCSLSLRHSSAAPLSPLGTRLEHTTTRHGSQAHVHQAHERS